MASRRPRNPYTQARKDIKLCSSDEAETEPETSAPFTLSEDRPIPFRAIAEQLTRQTRVCWGCIKNFSQPADEDADPSMSKVWSAYADNKGKMDEEELAYLVHCAHQDQYCEPLVKAGKGHMAMPWIAADVLIHIRFHMTDAAVIINRNIKDMTVLSAQFKDQIFSKVDGSETVQSNFPAFTAYNTAIGNLHKFLELQAKFK